MGLGYRYGISGMWLVVAIGAGVLLLSLLFAGTIQKLKIYTVSQMLTLRYGSADVRGRPCAVARQVWDALAARGWREPLEPCPRCPVEVALRRSIERASSRSRPTSRPAPAAKPAAGKKA
mgnify:CR=1 FL=1